MVFSKSKETQKIIDQSWDDMFNTETDLLVSEIRKDTVILKDWWLRAILKVQWLNLDLKTREEKQIAVQKYRKFLNGLDFPIQLLVRNTYLDLTDYIDYIDTNLQKLDNKTLEKQGEKYKRFLDRINSKQWFLYVKEFYVIVPYYVLNDKSSVRKPFWQKLMDVFTSKDSPEKIVERFRKFTKNKKELDRRVSTIKEGLRWVWLKCQRLKLSDIVSLLFKVYNPTSHENQS